MKLLSLYEARSERPSDVIGDPFLMPLQRVIVSFDIVSNLHIKQKSLYSNVSSVKEK